ncbi:hypothetical protein DKX38_026183 [Salix brachista]|uniref:Protein kinase domain-containing protein n=1 Tax=Salix brachista TaxID=2182728 RepID=A0A5N5JUM7_9ROSI|nr:hypothetical protein DKX38_026183 [Salix brachista]
MRLFPTRGPIVCRFWWCWPITSNNFLLYLLCYFSQLTFPAAALQQPAIATPPGAALHPPTTVPLKHHHSLFDHRFSIPLTASLLLLLLLAAIMGCFLGLKFRRKRLNKKDDAVVAASNGSNDLGPEKEKDFDHGAQACVRKYNWSEIEKLSMNFSQIVGSGGFSTVYLGHLPGSSLGAIKIHCPSDYLNRVFKQELDILLQLQHDNIVKLLGYCDIQDEGALVFEYVSNGTLQDKLHGAEIEAKNSSSSPVISWRNRMAIACQLVQALEYLHEKCPLQIVHGDIKPSNILLDEHLNCKLCDFGFAKMGFSSTIMTPNNRRKQVMVGSLGYTDPHYLRTGIASKKNDVYSYGVIILELVTGMEAFCEEREQGQLLTSIMGPILKDIIASDNECKAMKVAEMVDPKLGEDFEVKEVEAMLSLAALCLGQSPSLRPSATQILQTIKESIGSISFISTQKKDLSN